MRYMYFPLVKRYRFYRIFLFILNKCCSMHIDLLNYFSVHLELQNFYVTLEGIHYMFDGLNKLDQNRIFNDLFVHIFRVLNDSRLHVILKFGKCMIRLHLYLVQIVIIIFEEIKHYPEIIVQIIIHIQNIFLKIKLKCIKHSFQTCSHM